MLQHELTSEAARAGPSHDVIIEGYEPVAVVIFAGVAVDEQFLPFRTDYSG